VETFLDMLGLLLFIVVVIALAAGVTALVVKISPTKDKQAAKQQAQAPN
jgi:flagellar basal body-associated protein FliL